jgi:hypothetical protein
MFYEYTIYQNNLSHIRPKLNQKRIMFFYTVVCSYYTYTLYARIETAARNQITTVLLTQPSSEDV